MALLHTIRDCRFVVVQGSQRLPFHGKVCSRPAEDYKQQISAEYHSFSKAVGGRVDLAYYNVKGQQDLYVVPQAGLNFTSFLSLHFGYAIPLFDKRSEFLYPLKISIYLNVPSYFPRDGKFWPG